MNLDSSAAVYPACPVISRTVQIGGQSKAELLERLRQAGVQLNDAARMLFLSDKFTTSAVATQLGTVELSVGNLGFPRGGTMPELVSKALSLGLHLCPTELGPHVRLQFLNQPESDVVSQPSSRRHAPSGSITIASEMLSDEDSFPKGFYLRHIEGVLWLRGYWSGQDHVWDPEDRLIFAEEATQLLQQPGPEQPNQHQNAHYTAVSD